MDGNYKICSRCNLSKSIEEFNFRNKLKGSRHSCCRDCGKFYTHAHYKNNKSQYLSRNNRALTKRREIIRELKSRSCHDCGVQYPYYVMDFDHREDEVKELQINQVVRYTIKKLKNEIAKCDVVCANCHRERTFQRLSGKSSKS